MTKAPPAKTPQVVFILSLGHSGSTLLDFLIGSVPQAFSTGELTHLAWQLDRGRSVVGPLSEAEAREKQSVCTCKQSFWDCPVWSKVIAGWETQHDIGIADDPYRLNLSIMRNNSHADRKKLRMHWYRMIRGVYTASHFSFLTQPVRKILQTIQNNRIRNNWGLYQQLAQVTDSHWIVDSSKDLVRAVSLFHSRPSSVRFIILSRSIHGVVRSGQRRGRPPLETAKHWLRFHNRAWHLLNDQLDVRPIFVTYESIVQNASSTRTQIADQLGLTTSSKFTPLDSTQFHLVAGNPMRYSPSIEIEAHLSNPRVADDTLADQLDTMEKQLNPELKLLLAEASRTVDDSA